MTNIVDEKSRQERTAYFDKLVKENPEGDDEAAEEETI